MFFMWLMLQSRFMHPIVYRNQIHPYPGSDCAKGSGYGSKLLQKSVPVGRVGRSAQEDDMLEGLEDEEDDFTAGVHRNPTRRWVSHQYQRLLYHETIVSVYMQRTPRRPI